MVIGGAEPVILAKKMMMILCVPIVVSLFTTINGEQENNVVVGFGVSLIFYLYSLFVCISLIMVLLLYLYSEGKCENKKEG